MKKDIRNRLLSMVLTVVLVLSCLPGTALPVFAVETSGSCGENLIWTFDETTGTLSISGTGAMTDFESMVDSPWNDLSSDVKSIEIKEGVTSIGDYAFANLSNLEALFIPEGVISIGYRAICFCMKLEKVTFPSTVTTIGEFAFENCSKLGNITFPSDLKTIGNHAFTNCTNLIFTEIPEGVTEIGINAFYGCSALTTVSIPSTVTSIGNNTFRGCTNLSQITVDPANNRFSSVEGVLFNKDLTTLLMYPAQKSSDSYTIPSTVTAIGMYAFERNAHLKSIAIPNHVTSIQSLAFCNAGALESVKVGTGITELSTEMFGGCANLKNVELPNTLTRITNYVFWKCTSLTSIEIPDSVTRIESYAFGETGIASLVLPKNLTYVGNDLFDGCSSLQSVHYCGTQEDWGKVTGSPDHVPNLTLTTDNNNDHQCDICERQTPCVDTDSNGMCNVCGEHLVPQFKIEDYKLYVSNDGGFSWEEIGVVADGKSVESITKTGSNGNVDTYTILYSDGTSTTFSVTNGKDGVDGITPQFKVENSVLFVSYDNGTTWEELGNLKGDQGEQGVPGQDGHTPVITIQNGNWFVDGVDTGVAAVGIKGETGNGIASIRKTGIDGLVDTYTITYTDGTTTTFTVTNGEKGEQGIQGIQGIPGKDGHTPVIEIKDGCWYIDGVNTNIVAVGAKGEDGKDGVTPQLRINSHNIWEVSYDNGATWESLGISAVGQNGSNGTNGRDGKDGAGGKDGKDGVDGKDGITPKLRINDDNIWEVSYDGGKTWETLGVAATGADGVTPQLRINEDTNMWEVSYDNGATWTSMGVVATGANGKDGGSILPIIISCISLAGMVIMFCIMMADRKRGAYAGRQ